MKVTDSTADLTQHRNSIKTNVGFVPTMGNLHRGHLSLLERSLEENEFTYFSIFVNPTQFGPNEDFDKYPRTLEQDLKLLETVTSKYPSKSLVVFAPKESSEIYPPQGVKTINVGQLGKILEGEFRPTHFDGVATVVNRLFEIVRPDKAYFGLKDYQQCLVIKTMVLELRLPIQIIAMPIVREADGLAMSSRNQYLNPTQRSSALIVNQTLKAIKEVIQGKRQNLLKAFELIKELETDPNWNYLEIRDSETLSEDLTNSNEVTILGVYQLGATRLLDNMQMEIQ